RREVSLDEGIARVSATVAGGMHLPVDAVADAVLAEMAPPTGYDDDIAIVIYRHPYAPLTIDVAAAAEQLSDVRHQFGAWLRAAAIPEGTIADIVLAVNEAAANSIEHAYRGHEPGKVRIEAENDGARVHVRIIDKGSWKPARADPDVRGRGLLLIRALSDWLEMDCTSSGTTVNMIFHLPDQTS
ncbi:MAG: ATP-binding protein, partial [Mycobacterium sp.]